MISGEGCMIAGNKLYINVLYSDSGWTESSFASLSLNEVNAYFYGWKMCMSDGSTWDGVSKKYWKKITDGTGIIDVCPTATYEGYTPYKIIYQLATPKTEMTGISMPLQCYKGGTITISSGYVLPVINYIVPTENIKSTVKIMVQVYCL
jgi:hypothetical protein